MKTRRYQRPNVSPRFATLSVEPAGFSGQVLIRLATGEHANALTGGQVFGAFALEPARAHFEALCADLESNGFARGSDTRFILQLQANDRRVRARAAITLGWRKPVGAAEALLLAAQSATTEISSVMDALGRIGDTRAMPLARTAGEKKLLSRRRSGVEALRALKDSEGLAQARVLGFERLAEPVKAALSQTDEYALAGLAPLVTALRCLDLAPRGLALDQLYEFATPLCVAAVRVFMVENISQAQMWRYAKSIFKRAMLRGDAQTFAMIALSIERADHVKAQRAELKSGLDGQNRSSKIFSTATRAWMLRSASRHLRRLGYWQPEKYAEFASAILVRYELTDARVPRKNSSAFGGCWLLHRILYQASVRFSSWGTRVLGAIPPPKWHAMPFKQAWQLLPSALSKLLSEARLPILREMALATVLAEPSFMQAATSEHLSGILAAPEVAAQRLAGLEISRRFDREQPDIDLLCALLDGTGIARALALGLLDESANSALAQHPTIRALLSRSTGAGRAGATQAVLKILNLQPNTHRESLWTQLLHDLVISPLDADQLTAFVEVISAHAATFAPRLAFHNIAQLLDSPRAVQREVAAALLQARSDALTALGLPRVLNLAESNVPSLRRLACALLAEAVLKLQMDPTPLLRIADARFPDTRAAAMALISQIDFSRFGLDAIVALCDSNQTPVQSFARDWVGAHLERLDVAALLFKLIEHPHKTMQAFALLLIERHLPAGIAAFARVQSFLRLCLRRPRMPRIAKDRLIAFAKARAVDAEHAELAIALFNDSLRVATRADWEPLLVALSILRLRFPEIASDWQLAELLIRPEYV